MTIYSAYLYSSYHELMIVIEELSQLTPKTPSLDGALLMGQSLAI